MANDERANVEPLIQQLLEVIDEHSPGLRNHLPVQQAVSRLMFESYRRGLRRARRGRTTGLDFDRVDLPED
jgi:hypothetical protein